VCEQLGRLVEAVAMVRRLQPLPVQTVGSTPGVSSLHAAAIAALGHSGDWRAALDMLAQLRSATCFLLLFDLQHPYISSAYSCITAIARGRRG
jgi:hypothetical protein